MADTILTLNELGELFYDLIVAMIGGSPAIDVRRSWPAGGAPAWGITDDVIFFNESEDDNPINRQRDVVVSNRGSPYTDDLNQASAYTRYLRVGFVFYGPNSLGNSQVVRDFMFYQTHRETLAKNNIYLIPDTVAPKRAPEIFQGQWWERVDMSMNFNELVIRNLTIPAITSAEVIVYDEDGQVADVTIP